MPRDKTVSFKVSKGLYNRIREKARKLDKSQSDVLRDAVVEYLTEPVKREVIKQREERTEKLYQELTDQWKEQVSRLDRIVELLEEGIKKD
jgi:Arc/MetJ-type ribon-helix-helix transcriptional regulator